MNGKNYFMITRVILETLMNDGEVPLGAAENLSLKGDFSLADLVGLDNIPMILYCPQCSKRHVDQGAFARKKHHTHACQTCGHVWRPAIVCTVGVRFLPGFKDEENT